MNAGLSDSHSLHFRFPIPLEIVVQTFFFANINAAFYFWQDMPRFFLLKERLRRSFSMEWKNEPKRTKVAQSGIHFSQPECFLRQRRNVANVCVLIFMLLFGLLGNWVGNAEAAQVREMRVRVAVSPSYQTTPEWKEKFKQRLAYASSIFEREVGIKFTPVKFDSWNPADESDINTLFEDLRSNISLDGNIDLVIGLASAKNILPNQMNDSHIIGRARPFSGYLVLRHPLDPLFKIQEETVLIHELGHLFGAIHTFEPNTIMSAVIEKQIPTKFDPLNRDLVKLTRDIDFRKGQEALDERMIQFLLNSYQKLAGTGQPFEFYYALGHLHLKTGDFQNAHQALKKALELEPNSAQIHYDLGVLSNKIGLQDDAISYLTRASSLYQHPSESYYKGSALYMIGNAYYAKGNYGSAYSAWSEAVPFLPNDLDLRINMASARLKQGEYRDAIGQLEKAIQLGASNASVFGNLSLAYFQLQDYGKAVQYLNKSLSASSSSDRGPISASDNIKPAEIYHYLGSSYMKLNDPRNAMQNFEKACSMDPSAGCKRSLAQNYFSERRWDEVIRMFKEVLSEDNSNPDDYGMLGVALLQKGFSQDAEIAFQEGLKRSQNRTQQAHFHSNLGSIYLEANKLDQAMTQFRYAIDKNWNETESHVGLAIGYLRENQPENARSSLRHALAIDPNHQSARDLLSKIEANIGR